MVKIRNTPPWQVISHHSTGLYSLEASIKNNSILILKEALNNG